MSHFFLSFNVYWSKNLKLIFTWKHLTKFSSAFYEMYNPWFRVAEKTQINSRSSEWGRWGRVFDIVTIWLDWLLYYQDLNWESDGCIGWKVSWWPSNLIIRLTTIHMQRQVPESIDLVDSSWTRFYFLNICCESQCNIYGNFFKFPHTGDTESLNVCRY